MSHTYTTTVINQAEVADRTKRFDLAKPEGFAFRAGQTIDVKLPRVDAEPLSHTFSIVTAPHEEVLSIATRMRDSEYKNLLNSLPPDSGIQIEGPYGSFFLHTDERRPAVFLVGGIGITPFMSMIRDAAHRTLPHKLFLFYANRNVSAAAFLTELQAAEQKQEQLTVVPTMTDTETDWDGETGYIDWAMIQRSLPADAEPIFYMAGPAPMVTAMRTLLSEHNVSEDDIRFEEFAGY